MSGRVLVIDDDVEFAESQRDVLVASGHAVALAHSAERGLALLEEEVFDVVLLDMRMPKMEGMEWLTTIRRRGDRERVIFVTAFTRGQVLTQALSAGVVVVMKRDGSEAALLDMASALGTRISILVISSETDGASLIRALESQGHVARLALSTESARSSLKAHPVSLIMIDVDVDGGGAIDLIAQLTRDNSPPVVAIATNRSSVDSSEFVHVFSEDILTKPFSPRELLARL